MSTFAAVRTLLVDTPNPIRIAHNTIASRNEMIEWKTGTKVRYGDMLGS